MEAKHTPGPWMVQNLEDSHHGYADWPTFAVRSKRENYCLVVVGDVDRATASNNKANAKLIAAAPDLLDACKTILQASELSRVAANSDDIAVAKDTYRSGMAKVRAAIAAAAN